MRNRVSYMLDKTEMQFHTVRSMIQRTAEQRITQALQYFPCIVLTGARQTGKTTLLRSLLPEYNYVSLDLPSTASLAEETPELFFEKYKRPLIIDEVQYAPKLFRFIKTELDAQRHTMGQLILTGSQKFPLMKNVSESLAGRTCILELEGLSWQEYKNAPCFSKECPADFYTFLFRGGFPELTRISDFPVDMFFSSYLATYLERDVRQLINVSNLRLFEQCIRLLAIRNAQMLDMAQISNALGVSAKTIAAWLSVLETSGQITFLQPWSGNTGKRIVKTPKVYFNDTGLLCWLLGIEKDKLRTSPFAGSIFETAVFSELRKYHKCSGNKKQLYYYRDVSQAEVDFLEIGDGCRLIEAKQTENPSLKDVQGIKKLHERLHALPHIPKELQPFSYCIACTCSENFPLRVSTAAGEIIVQVRHITDVISNTT